jgi:plasmid stabilization system protein ParE
MEKKYAVSTAPQAKAELDEICFYFLRVTLDFDVVTKIRAKIEAAISGLAFMPQIRPVVFMGVCDENFRKEICGDYIIPFRIYEETKTVVVSRIFNGRANYQQYLN